MESFGKIKSRWTRSFFTALDMKTDEEKYICDICQKDLGTPAQLALHRLAHDIEKPFKCEICQVPFVSSVQLQKHFNSSAHKERVRVTEDYGHPTVDNPRPFKCDQCTVAFRKPGHLDKHRKSKAHITKLESNGVILPDKL